MSSVQFSSHSDSYYKDSSGSLMSNVAEVPTLPLQQSNSQKDEFTSSRGLRHLSQLSDRCDDKRRNTAPIREVSITCWPAECRTRFSAHREEIRQLLLRKHVSRMWKAPSVCPAPVKAIYLLWWWWNIWTHSLEILLLGSWWLWWCSTSKPMIGF